MLGCTEEPCCVTVCAIKNNGFEVLDAARCYTFGVHVQDVKISAWKITDTGINLEFS